MSDKTQQLIDDLNNDLAYELSAIIQYLTYSARVTGPYRQELSRFFMEEVPDETAHAEYLANKIVALGGVPTTVPKPVEEASGARAMLEAVARAEADAAKRYTARALQAEEAGRKGLQVQLEDMVRDETEHLEQTERILRDWKE